MVADGSGGLAPVTDRRFEPDGWAFVSQISADQIDDWFLHLRRECTERGWSLYGIQQLDAKENSGSTTVSYRGDPPIEMAIAWERKSAGRLSIRAKGTGSAALSADEIKAFFDKVDERCRARNVEQFYRRGVLVYHGLAWRGELWLDSNTRLGPPSLQYEESVIGPRIIVVDTVVNCVNALDSGPAMLQLLRELSAFLSVVLGTDVSLPDGEYSWVFPVSVGACEVRRIGYFEKESPTAMPVPGSVTNVPLKPVTRPDYSMRGIDGTTNELPVAEEIVELWKTYRGLASDLRRDFLQAAMKWQEAMTHWVKERTLSFALLVVACEALKPPAAAFNEHNIYDVIEALLGNEKADRLREQTFRPQDTRNAHLHRGVFRASEFIESVLMFGYRDPTFNQTHRELTMISQEAIIQWLRRGGIVSLPVREKRKSLRRMVRKKTWLRHWAELLWASCSAGCWRIGNKSNLPLFNCRTNNDRQIACSEFWRAVI